MVSFVYSCPSLGDWAGSLLLCFWLVSMCWKSLLCIPLLNERRKKEKTQCIYTVSTLCTGSSLVSVNCMNEHSLHNMFQGQLYESPVHSFPDHCNTLSRISRMNTSSQRKLWKACLCNSTHFSFPISMYLKEKLD